MNSNKWLKDYTNDKSLAKFFNDDFWNKRIYTLDGIDKGMKKGKKEGIKEGKKEGIKEGIEEGKKVGHEEIANEMLKQNYKVEEIAKLTKLKIQEIMNLKRKLDLK